jgi:2-oxoglutarate dehydrogenase complex dehydrogenase (E1) component-like enzyme
VVNHLADLVRMHTTPPRYRNDDSPAPGVRKLLLCSGNIFWELAAAGDKRELDDTAIVRIEQLYPLPHRQLAAILDRYPNARDVRWVQEEPANQGDPHPPCIQVLLDPLSRQPGGHEPVEHRRDLGALVGHRVITHRRTDSPGAH